MVEQLSRVALRALPSPRRSSLIHRIPARLLPPSHPTPLPPTGPHALRASNSTGNGSGAAVLQQQPPATTPPRSRRLRVAYAAAALAVSDFRSEVIAGRMGDLGVRVVGRGCAAPMEPRKEMLAQQHPPLFMDFSRRDGVADGGNGRKRPRETVAPPARLFSLHAPRGSPGHKVIHLAQLHRRPPATGLRLDFDEGVSEHVACTSSTSSLLPGELAAQCGRYNNEIDRLLQEHTERLRLALADTRRRQNRSLLGAAEALAARRVREMEAETFKAARRGVELEERLARLRAEAASWQSKAMSDQSTAAALHAQLQQAAATAQARSGKAALDDDGAAGAADDAESGFVDPDRVVEVVAAPPARPCRACRLRPATTVLLPCRHLCVCDACDPRASGSLAGTAAAAACPTCRCPVTGTVQVFFA